MRGRAGVGSICFKNFLTRKLKYNRVQLESLGEETEDEVMKRL